jgi:hypothetical protein
MPELDESVELENLQQVVKTLRDGLGPITTAYLATKVLTLEAKLAAAENRIAVLEKGLTKRRKRSVSYRRGRST